MAPPHPESSNRETQATHSPHSAGGPAEQPQLLAWYDMETLSATGAGLLNIAPNSPTPTDYDDTLTVTGDGLYSRAGLSSDAVTPGSLCFCSATAKFMAAVPVTSETHTNPAVSISMWIKLTNAIDYESGTRDMNKWIYLLRLGTIDIGVHGTKLTIRDRGSVFHSSYNDGDWVHIGIIASGTSLDVHLDGNHALHLNANPQQIPVWNGAGVLEITNPMPHKHNMYLDEMRVYRGILSDDAIKILANPVRYASEDPYVTDNVAATVPPLLIQLSDLGPHFLDPIFKNTKQLPCVEFKWKLLAPSTGVQLVVDEPSQAKLVITDESTALGEHDVLFSAHSHKTGNTFTAKTRIVILQSMAKPKGEPYLRPIPQTNPVNVGEPIRPVAFWDFKPESIDDQGMVTDVAKEYAFTLNNTYGELIHGDGPGGRDCIKVERVENGGDYLRKNCVQLPSLPLTEEFSFSFWLFANDSDFNRRGIISQDDQGEFAKVKGIEVQLWTNVLRVCMRVPDMQGSAKASARCRTAHWTHYTFVFGKEGQCRVYRNGMSDFTQHDGFGSCIFSQKPDGTLPFHLGISYGECRSSIKTCPMRMSDLAFFNVALNSDEAELIFADGPLGLTNRLDGFSPFPNRLPMTAEDVWYSKRTWKEMCPRTCAEEIATAYEAYPSKGTESSSTLFGDLPDPYVHPRLAFNLDDLKRIRQNLLSTALGKSSYFHLLLLTNHGRQTTGVLDKPFASEKIKSGYADLANEGNSAVHVQECLRILIQCDVAAAAQAIPRFLDSCQIIIGKLLEFERPENTKLPSFQVVHAGNVAVTKTRRRNPFLRPFILTSIPGVHNSAVGLLYDFLYPFMIEEERGVARRSLQLATQNFWVYGLGMPYQYTFNWVAFGLNLGVLCMAIEDEDGYDPTTARLCRESYNRHMTTYYEPTTGGCLEGELKTALGTNFVPFYARRSEKAASQFIGLENFFEKFVPAIYHPSGKLCVAGSGTLTNNAVIQGKWDARLMLHSEYIMAGYVYQRSPAVKQMIGLLSGQDIIGGLERAKGAMAWSPVSVTNLCFLPKDISVDQLGVSFWKNNAESPNAFAPLALFCSERSLFTARSDLTRDALMLYSEFPMGDRGHTYLHSGAFKITSNEVTWIQRYSEEARNTFGIFVVAYDDEGAEKLVGQTALNPSFICDIEDQSSSVSSISGDLRCKYITGMSVQPHRSWFGRPGDIRSLQEDPRRDLIYWREHNKPGICEGRAELQRYETGMENKGTWNSEDVEYPPASLARLPDFPKVAYRTLCLVRGNRPIVLVSHDHEVASPQTYHFRLPVDSNVYMDSPTSIAAPGIGEHEKFRQILGQPAIILRQASNSHCTKRMLILFLIDPKSCILGFRGGFHIANTVTGSTPHARWTYGLDFRSENVVETLKMRVCFIPYDESDAPVSVEANHSESKYSILWVNGDKQEFAFGSLGPFNSSDVSIKATGAEAAVVNRGSSKFPR